MKTAATKRSGSNKVPLGITKVAGWGLVGSGWVAVFVAFVFVWPLNEKTRCLVGEGYEFSTDLRLNQ